MPNAATLWDTSVALPILEIVVDYVNVSFQTLGLPGKAALCIFSKIYTRQLKHGYGKLSPFFLKSSANERPVFP